MASEQWYYTVYRRASMKIHNSIMTFNKMMTTCVFFTVMGSTIAGIIAPAPLAPILAPATIGYGHAVPQNIPPHASRIDISTRALAAPYVAAAAPYASVAPSAPIIAAPGFIGTAFAGSLAAPIAPLTAAPYGPALLG